MPTFVINIVVAFLSLIIAVFEFKKDEKLAGIFGIAIAVVSLASLPIVNIEMPPVELYPTDGKISEDGEVTLSTEPGFEIYYTLDPTKDPGVDGIAYEAPFKIEKGTQLNAKSHFLFKWGSMGTWELQLSPSGEVTSTKGKMTSLEAEYVGGGLESGDVLTREDFRVTGLLADGTEVEIRDFTIGEGDYSQPGSHEVRIAYGSLETTCEVTTVGMTGIEAIFQGEGVEVGDTLTKGMFDVRGVYSDGTKEKIDDFTISPTKLSEPGDQLVTIGYKGERASVTVTVEEKPDADDSLREESEGIMAALDASLLSDSGTYAAYLGDETINVYAEDQHDAFSINTAADYNLWGGGEQDVSFRVDKLGLSTIKFNICGETGTSGAMTVTVFLDKSASDENPDYTFELDDAPYPVAAEIDVRNRQTMAIHVSNHAGHDNRLVFYGFEGV